MFCLSRPEFPFDFPDTQAGQQQSAQEARLLSPVLKGSRPRRLCALATGRMLAKCPHRATLVTHRAKPQGAECQSRFLRRPPAKRPNFELWRAKISCRKDLAVLMGSWRTRLGVHSPHTPDWSSGLS